MLVDLQEYNKEVAQEIGLGIGELFYEKVAGAGLDIGEAAVFDTDSFNYHLYPKKRDEALENEIKTKRDDVIKYVERTEEKFHILLREKGINIYSVRTSKEMDELTSDNGNIYFYGNNNGKLKGVDSNLFRYIAAVKNGVLYELNFMRFFISKDSKVNCVLKSIQFDRVVDNQKVIMKGRVNKNRICYPASYRNQTLDKILEKKPKGSFFYNPRVSFNDGADKILTAFVEFIEECDKRL